MSLENKLTGENLALYHNIKDLKKLTVKARALITRSHTVFNDIIQGDQLKKRARGTEVDDDDHSLKSVHGECVKCGLHHGAHDFCILHEIMTVEKHRRQKSSASDIFYQEDAGDEGQDASTRTLPPVTLPRKVPPRQKVEKWENLLHREMTPKELDEEYSKICYRYGEVTGRKFLLARSLARGPDPVQPLFTGESQEIREKGRPKDKTIITSIMRECVSRENLFPELCPDFSPKVSQKIATVLDVELPCKINTLKYNKAWKDVFKVKHQAKSIARESIALEDEYSHSLFSSGSRFSNASEWCNCMLDECECGANPSCTPPNKNCLTTVDFQNNYLLTVRERLRQNRILAGKIPKEFHHTIIQSPSKRISHDFLRRDSEMMLIKSQGLYQKDLKNCITSSIGGDLEHVDLEKLDANVQKITEITSVFTKPDERAWDKWIERFHAQDEIGEERSISGDSSFPTSSSSTTSTTDQELGNHRPSKKIPFMQEPFKLVDMLFSKIFSRFKKSILKSSMKGKFNTYRKRLFFTHVDNLIPHEYAEIIRRKLMDKLNLHCIYLKRFQPDHVIKAERLKRLKAKSKRLSRVVKRRKYVEGIQLGKRYRRPRKSANFTNDKGFIGFIEKDRNLLQKPTLERFTAFNLVGDVSGSLLSKERIHYHYRLLRLLFNGPIESEDRESLMDEGMRERLQNFKKTLHNNSWTQFDKESNTEDDGMDLLKAASVPIRSPLKKDERKLKSAPGYSPSQARASKDSPKLSNPSNPDGNRSRFEGTNRRTNKTSSYKSPREITSRNRNERLDSQLSNRTSSNAQNEWCCKNAPSHPEELIVKSSEKSSQRLPSENITNPTQSNGTYTLQRTLNKISKVFKDNSHSYVQWAPYRLPTPPLSESSSEELDFESVQHRVPPKEEAHIEKSARRDTKSRESQIKQNISQPQLQQQFIHEVEESEHTDKTSESYVPQLLKVPSKRTLANPGSSISFNQDSQSKVRHKYRSRTRARATYVSESSSTDTETANPSCRNERPAWDHKSGLNRNVAPYLDTQCDVTSRRRHDADIELQRMYHMKSTFMSPLPKAGRSILKNSSVPKFPKPPSDGTRENLSKTLVIDPVEPQTFSDSSCRTTSWPSDGLLKPARVITEHLLKAPHGHSEDIPTGSSKKYSSLSRATPDAFPSNPPSTTVSGVATKKITVSPVQNVPTAGQTEDGDEAIQHHVSIKISSSRRDSPSHPAADSSRKISSSHPDEPHPLLKTESLRAASSKRLSKRSSKLVSEVFRQRSLAPSELSAEKKELQKKFGKSKKGFADGTSLQNVSNSSMQAKLKKLEAIGPTNKRSFNLDIGQGINCVNYLKENAPGADEAKKKELVDLLCTHVEVKKAAKKVEKEVSMDSSLVRSVQSAARESTSSSLFSPTQSSKVAKPQAHAVRDDATPLTKKTFKSLDQIYKEVHGINEHNTPRKLVENDYEYEAKKKQQLTKHKISP